MSKSIYGIATMTWVCSQCLRTVTETELLFPSDEIDTIEPHGWGTLYGEQFYDGNDPHLVCDDCGKRMNLTLDEYGTWKRPSNG